MGEDLERKRARKFRHEADAVMEAELKSRNLFSSIPTVLRTLYRCRLTREDVELSAGTQVILGDEGDASISVFMRTKRIGEVDAAGTAELRVAFAAEQRAAGAVYATVVDPPGLSGMFTVKVSPKKL
jgi:hypothetical protein